MRIWPPAAAAQLYSSDSGMKNGWAREQCSERSSQSCCMRLFVSKMPFLNLRRQKAVGIGSKNLLSASLLIESRHLVKQNLASQKRSLHHFREYSDLRSKTGGFGSRVARTRDGSAHTGNLRRRYFTSAVVSFQYSFFAVGAFVSRCLLSKPPQVHDRRYSLSFLAVGIFLRPGGNRTHDTGSC